MATPFLLIALGGVVVRSTGPDDSPAVDFGFPRCYTSFDDYDTAFVDDRANHEVRPLMGHTPETETSPNEGSRVLIFSDSLRKCFFVVVERFRNCIEPGN